MKFGNNIFLNNLTGNSVTNKVFVLFAITIVHFQSAIFSMKNVDKKNKLVALKNLDFRNIKDFAQKDQKRENNNITKKINVQINKTNKNEFKFEHIKDQEPLNFLLLNRDSYNCDISDDIYDSDDSTETRIKKELIQIRGKYGSDARN